MIILIAGALAAAAPAPNAPVPSAQDAHRQAVPMTDMPQHKQADACDCCKDMAAKHENHGSDHVDHSGH